jgi:hypothetical protein
VASYPLSGQAPTHVEVVLGCDNTPIIVTTVVSPSALHEGSTLILLRPLTHLYSDCMHFSDDKICQGLITVPSQTRNSPPLYFPSKTARQGNWWGLAVFLPRTISFSDAFIIISITITMLATMKQDYCVKYYYYC